MTITWRQAAGVALGAATGFTAYQLWNDHHNGNWPADAAAWSMIAVWAAVVGILTAIFYTLVLTLRERRAGRSGG